MSPLARTTCPNYARNSRGESVAAQPEAPVPALLTKLLAALIPSVKSLASFRLRKFQTANTHRRARRDCDSWWLWEIRNVYLALPQIQLPQIQPPQARHRHPPL